MDAAVVGVSFTVVITTVIASIYYLIPRHLERKRWNKGFCGKCGSPWILLKDWKFYSTKYTCWFEHELIICHRIDTEKVVELQKGDPGLVEALRFFE